VSLSDLASASNDIVVLNTCMHGNVDQVSALSFSTERPEAVNGLISSSRFLYINMIEIAETFVAYTIEVDATPELHENNIQWNSTSLRLFNVQYLAAGKVAFGGYADNMRLTSPATGIIKRKID
jgi:hypothetical protein